MQAGEHDLQSNEQSKGVVSMNLRGAVELYVQLMLLALGSLVHASLQKFSPGRRVPFDKHSSKAVDRLVQKTCKGVISARVGGGWTWMARKDP